MGTSLPVLHMAEPRPRKSTRSRRPSCTVRGVVLSFRCVAAVYRRPIKYRHLACHEIMVYSPPKFPALFFSNTVLPSIVIAGPRPIA